MNGGPAREPRKGARTAAMNGETDFIARVLGNEPVIRTGFFFGILALMVGLEALFFR